MIQIWQRRNCFLGTTQQYYTPAIDTYPLKNGGWETLLSFWVPAYFQGLLLLALGRVTSTLRLFLCQTNHHFFLSQLICRMILPFPFVFFFIFVGKTVRDFSACKRPLKAPWMLMGAEKSHCTRVHPSTHLYIKSRCPSAGLGSKRKNNGNDLQSSKEVLH